MERTDYIDFEKKLAFHTAPTLLGIKCSNLMSLPLHGFDVDSYSETFNRKAASKGLKIKTLCECSERRLVLICNEKLLKKRLSEPETRRMLSEFGYSWDMSCSECLDMLSERIRTSGEFPHEIGIFLGYPLEDVEGFIRRKGEKCKLCGYWKVYGSVENAKRIFDNYDKCRKFLCNKLNEGEDIYHALRIS